MIASERMKYEHGMLKQAKKAKQMCAKLHVNFIPSAKKHKNNANYEDNWQEHAVVV